MFKQAKPIFLIVETPLHAGSGTDLGIVDLPIQREKHTDYPKIEASGIKGAIRDIFSTQPNLQNLRTLYPNGNLTSVKDPKHEEAVTLAFGPDTADQSNLHGGALGFTDARLLLFPVKSVSGVFGWITCPAVLERFKSDLSICELGNTFDVSLPGENQVPEESGLIINENKVVLEEYTFDEVAKTDECTKLADWISQNCMPSGSVYTYWQDKMKKDLIVLSNDDFRDFVKLSTEVIARIKINPKTGTVKKGGLWYEEYLPSDSILYSLALTSPIFQEDDKKRGIFELTAQDQAADLDESKKVMNFLEKGLPDVIQLGGNATIGKGIVRTKIC